ncbi:MAG: M3 family oligoendopeptidase [Candidatus Lokiarchaeota archaeon]|nr:M3 family oligoendopeptidase [Candidatus Lokiarchaeota archaeon]
MNENEIAWDLSEIFSNYDDPRISKNMDVLQKQVNDFVSTYKGKINTATFSAHDLFELFKKQEKFDAEIDELLTYAHLNYDANMTIPELGTLKKKVDDFITETSKTLAFFTLEIGKLVHGNSELIDNPVLKDYKHYLEKIKRSVPHLLSEIEEQLILEKDQYGIKAWSELQGKWLNTREFEVMVEGEMKVLSYGEANSLITHPDRATRISTNKSIYGLLGKDQEVFSTALRNICSDWMKNTKRRKYDSPMHHSFIINDTTQVVIDGLMKVIEENVGVYQRYLRLKAKVMQLSKLTCADVRAPLEAPSMKNRTWEEAKELAMEAYGRVDDDFKKYVTDMFDKNHIDAAVRKGKRNGAYCASWYKGKTAFILQSFTGALSEIYTLAHELGHAVHDYLASNEQSFFNLHPGATVAETASTFGELLMTDLLLTKAESKDEKRAILAHVLDDTGQAAFQVSGRVFFEQSLYKAIENGENLDGPTISKYWCAGRDRIYGDSVEWFNEMIWEWTMKPHYFMPNFRFYNYPYVYAQLFVFALYRKYKEEGQAFIPKFKKLLSSGGSLSPIELANIVGLDITQPDFWKLGIKQIEEFINEFEKIIK